MKEFESRPQKQDVPKTTIGSTQLVDLSLYDKQQLVLFAGTPAYSAILKLMEVMLVEARDAAVLADPAVPAAQLAALNKAHAMAALFVSLKEKITYLVEEHLGLMSRKEAEVAMEDREMIESVIFDQINQGR